MWRSSPHCSVFSQTVVGTAARAHLLLIYPIAWLPASFSRPKVGRVHLIMVPSHTLPSHPVLTLWTERDVYIRTNTAAAAHTAAPAVGSSRRCCCSLCGPWPTPGLLKRRGRQGLSGSPVPRPPDMTTTMNASHSLRDPRDRNDCCSHRQYCAMKL